MVISLLINSIVNNNRYLNSRIHNINTKGIIMALNNISNEKITHILLIITLTMSGYSTFSNTQINDDERLLNKLDMITALKEDINNKLYYINEKVDTNSFEIKIINAKLNELERSINELSNKISYIHDETRMNKHIP